MTSMERVLATMGHREPDRVPLFLLLSLHGAKELGLSIRQYFARPEHVIEGQLRLARKYRNDCLYALFYAPIEVEAWGGEVLWFDDGPPNSGEPFLRDRDSIRTLEPPRVSESPMLQKVLEAIRGLSQEEGGRVPVVGVVMSPFSLPVMQMGFDAYIELIYEDAALFERLMRVNEAFCVDWANAQLQAGANAICYFDPVSSPTCVPPLLYRKTGCRVARRTLPRIFGPTATHFASGRALAVVDDVAQTGTQAIGVGPLEDLAALKAACKGRLTILGNLNGVEMRHWSQTRAEDAVREALRKAAPGGGYILSDQHGEIPWQVPDDVLLALSEAVHRHGSYPIACEIG